MSTVTIIGTFHTEIDACSSEELYQIVKQIAPEVIFCESPLEIFQQQLSATEDFNPPEMKVIRKLIKEGDIKVVPVDVYGIAVKDDRINEIFDWFKEKMDNYKNAGLSQIDATNKNGYSFLNSNLCDKINFDKILMEKEMVCRENNEVLKRDYAMWLKWNKYREKLWIKKIQDYFDQNKFNNALLLAGAAHRVGLKQLIAELKFYNQTKLKWNFDYFSN
ncbi:hypothetical protein Q4595_11910 [Wenyingzhuangia sp. 1_MG-2023]|nr:hypothetical protein [Wenyingzhuangia sp. 1_MG-2023]